MIKNQTITVGDTVPALDGADLYNVFSLLFNLKKGCHFFTANAAEKDALVATGFTVEEAKFKAY